jgi:peptidoglycan/LPS O-acetylase OafA/YrhL
MANKFEGADGIRGLACLIVLLLHAVVLFYSSTLVYLAGCGKIGVWLFFVLSAFLLTNKFSGTGFSVGELFKYALGRFLRILPLFVISVLIYWLFEAVGIVSLSDVRAAILFEKGYAHFWTIPVEFKFYAVLPLMAFTLIWVRSRLGLAPFMMFSATLLVAHQVLWPYWDTPIYTIDTVWYLPCFLLGCVAAIVMPECRRLVTPARATLCAAIVLILMALSSPAARLALLGMPLDYWLMNKFIYLGALWAVFVVFLADGKGFVGSLLKAKFMRLMGAWSYSIYLIHYLFFVKMSVHQDSLLWMALGIVCAVASGAAMHYLIEAPIERLRHRVTIPLRPRPASV